MGCLKQKLSKHLHIQLQMIGASELVGAVKKNMLANLLITSGNIFNDDCVVYENWVQGTPYRFIDLRIKDIRGTYDMTVDTSKFKLALQVLLINQLLKLVLIQRK